MKSEHTWANRKIDENLFDYMNLDEIKCDRIPLMSRTFLGGSGGRRGPNWVILRVGGALYVPISVAILALFRKTVIGPFLEARRGRAPHPQITQFGPRRPPDPPEMCGSSGGFDPTWFRPNSL